MKIVKTLFFSAAVAVAILPACKAKKAVVAPPVTESFPPAPPAEKPKPTPTPAAEPTPAAPAPAPPDYNFKNIQFEFNSGILRTESYPILDKAVSEMKKDPSVKFVLNGNSSAEGTAEHNMQLSVERANAVKQYLTNSGINGDNLAVKGWGEAKPAADNTTEEGRILNRRVEIKKL